MRVSPLFYLLLALLLPLLTVRPAAADELQGLLAQLQRSAAQTRTLSSSFVQEKHLAIFAETLVSKGRFAFQRPDQLRWELLTPVDSGFILRGDEGERWNRLSDERGRFNVTGDPLMGMIAQQLLAWARVDLDWLQRRYRIELQAQQPLQLRLTPLDPGEAGFIDHLQITFSADRRYVAEVLMVEPEGDSTRLSFQDVRINAELPADSFKAPEL